MSAAGRGPRRGGKRDVYGTPKYCVDRLLDVWKAPRGTWLEPGAGSGAIIRAVNARRGDVFWIAVEIRKSTYAKLSATGATTYIENFLRAPHAPVEAITVVLGNPPFRDAMAFIERAREVAPLAHVAFLLRTNFAESEERAAWFRRNAPDIYVLPNRPSFRGGKTDATSYAWFVWPPGTGRRAGTFRVLGSTPLVDRKVVA